MSEVYDNILKGDAYLEGNGVEKNIPIALAYYLHASELEDRCSILSKADFGDRFVKVFNLLKEEAKNGADYPDLNCALAIMYKEGIGTEFDYPKYCYYSRKIDDQSYSYSDRPAETIDRTNEVFEMLRKYYKNVTANANQIITVFDMRQTTDNMGANYTDYVSLGKYNHRSLLWKFVKEINGIVILISSQCIESAAVIHLMEDKLPHRVEGTGNYPNDYFLDYIKDSMFDECEYEKNKKIDEILVPTKDGRYMFIPSYKMAMSIGFRQCLATDHAINNGVEVVHRDYMHSARWQINTPMTPFDYINIYGKSEVDAYEDSISHSNNEINDEDKVEVFERLLADEDELYYYLEEHFKMEDDSADFKVVEDGVIVQNLADHSDGTFYTFRNFVYEFCNEEDLIDYFEELGEDEEDWVDYCDDIYDDSEVGIRPCIKIKKEFYDELVNRQKKKIVVLTGSFNPVTKAHFEILSKAVEYLHADKGLFVATNDKYLTKKTVVDAKTRTKFFLSEDIRKEMLESLNKENNKLFFGGFELGGESPKTNATLRKILKENMGYDLYYLCGADKLKGIPHWSDFEDLINNIHVCVIDRKDINIDKIINNPEWASHKDKVIIFNTTDDIKEVSSTELRNNYFKGLDYKSLMNEGPYNILKGIDPNSFKELTEQYIIENTIKYGGRFGGNAARKLVYKSNTKLFNNWDNKLLGDRDSKIYNTKVYKEEFRVNSNNNYNTLFDCVNEDCVDVAYNLINEGLNPAILNLASNVHPCGGYDSGSLAQEESLSYSSTLSQSLYQFGNPKKKYFKDANLKHIPGVYPMDINYGGIYSPNVCFFRNNIDKYYTLRDKTFNCSVISVASLSNRQKNEWTNDESIYFDNNGLLTKEGIEIESNKIRTIYRIALANNHDSLVLGAFGCGVYNLNPNQVANLFKNILEEAEFKNKFKKIVFAIFEGKGSSRKVVGKEGKFKVFYDIFK